MVRVVALQPWHARLRRHALHWWPLPIAPPRLESVTVHTGHDHVIAFLAPPLRPMPKEHAAEAELRQTAFVARLRKADVVHGLAAASVGI